MALFVFGPEFHPAPLYAKASSRLKYCECVSFYTDDDYVKV
jgi:hypothetical protein